MALEMKDELTASVAVRSVYYTIEKIIVTALNDMRDKVKRDFPESEAYKIFDEMSQIFTTYVVRLKAAGDSGIDQDSARKLVINSYNRCIAEVMSKVFALGKVTGIPTYELTEYIARSVYVIQKDWEESFENSLEHRNSALKKLLESPNQPSYWANSLRNHFKEVWMTDKLVREYERTATAIFSRHLYDEDLNDDKVLSEATEQIYSAELQEARAVAKRMLKDTPERDEVLRGLPLALNKLVSSSKNQDLLFQQYNEYMSDNAL